GMAPSTLTGRRERVERLDTLPISGRVVRSIGLLVESLGPPAGVGDICQLERSGGEPPLLLEVVGFRDGHLLTIPPGSTSNIPAGDCLRRRDAMSTAPAGARLLGRVIDGLGRPIDGLGPLGATDVCPLHPPPLNPLDRAAIVSPLGTGVRAIDALLTV